MVEVYLAWPALGVRKPHISVRTEAPFEPHYSLHCAERAARGWHCWYE